MMINKKWIALILAVLCVIVVIPPIIHGYIYPTGGDDTAHHLTVIRTITPSNPIPPKYLYDGQWIVGYPLILIENYFHIPITVSFLWFNYFVLIGVILTNYFVFSKLFNQYSGVLAAIVGLLGSTNVALWQAGAIFNIINMSIIFPWLLYCAIMGITQKKWLGYSITFVCLSLVFMIFHASGIYAITLPFILLAIILLKKKPVSLIATVSLGILVVCLLVVAYLIPNISVDAGRQWVDASNLIWLLLASIAGLAFNKIQKNYALTMAAMVAVVLGYLSLPAWFSYTSAIKPIDRQIIAYINTLPESNFYGNDCVAPYIYAPYLNKLYKSSGEVYIWRSEPMTTGVTKDTKYSYWSKEGAKLDTSVPTRVKSMKYFDDGGIVAYVAETSH